MTTASFRPLLASAVCFFFAAAAPAEPRRTIPVDGLPFEAELIAADAQWQLTFQQNDRRRPLPAADLVRWGSPAETVRGPVIVTADGGLLVGDVLAADPEKLVADSALFGLVELPAEQAAAVVFSLPSDRRARDLLLDRACSYESTSDQVMLVNGDVVDGRFRRIHEDKVELDADVGPLEIEVDRVRAVVFNPTLLDRPRREGLWAVAGFADGTRLVVDRLIVAGESVEITAAGRVWRTARDELVCLQPLGGRAVYLSDLEPSGDRQLPFLELDWPPYRNDRDVTGGWLRCGGRLYLKGLGVHSAARLTYTLEEPYRRFEALLGIDDHTAGQGSVRFLVYVDGRRQYASPIVRGGDEPTAVSVDVAGAKRLDLIVDYADRADVMDRADWLEARLVP